MGLRFVVFYGSVRSRRQGIKAARYVTRRLAERGHAVSLIDPLQHELPLLDRMYKEFDPQTAPAPLRELAELIAAADAFVVVSGEYNHSIPPALSNLMDHFLEEYFWRPSAIVCYSAGRFGGVRAAMQLRSFLAEIGAPTIPTLFPIANVQDAFDDAGNPLAAHYDEALPRFLDELEWYAKALRDAREKHSRPY